MSANNQELRRAWAGSVQQAATALARHDPASIAEGNPNPAGEYRAEAEALVRYLCAPSAAQNPAAVVRKVLDDAFGPGFEIADDALEGLTRDLLSAVQPPSGT
jgi:hypothetical protein